MASNKASITRSLNTIRTELEYLRDEGVLSPPQFGSIEAQLPVCPFSLKLLYAIVHLEVVLKSLGFSYLKISVRYFLLVWHVFGMIPEFIHLGT